MAFVARILGYTPYEVTPRDVCHKVPALDKPAENISV